MRTFALGAVAEQHHHTGLSGPQCRDSRSVLAGCKMRQLFFAYWYIGIFDINKEGFPPKKERGMIWTKYRQKKVRNEGERL